jgi:hypothetical protein
MKMTRKIEQVSQIRSLFIGDGPERAGADNAFVHFSYELLIIYDPCLLIPYFEKLRVQCGTGPAADA